MAGGCNRLENPYKPNAPILAKRSCTQAPVHELLSKSSSRQRPFQGAQSSRRIQALLAYQEQACQAPTSENGAKQPGHIFTSGRDDSWDGGAVKDPVVRCYWGDNEYRWMMWYNGVPSTSSDSPLPVSSIGLALSADGVHWQRYSDDSPESSDKADIGRVLSPNSDWWWHDTRHINVSDVQIFSSDAVNTGVGVYWMFYSGGSFEEATAPHGLPPFPEGDSIEGLRTRVGLAMSQDGRNWARIEANHHTGALFDAGDPADWDEVLNGRPQVEAVGPNKMRMYYHSYVPSEKRWVVGLATSRDGFKWEKQGPIFSGTKEAHFDIRGAASHHVVKDVDAKRYVMFYEAVAADDSRSISMAVSKDGVSDWKCLGAPVLSAGESSVWDAGGVGSPCAVNMEGGKWRLYYSGKQTKSSQWQGIGLAITDAEQTDSFEGVRTGFKRRSAK